MNNIKEDAKSDWMKIVKKHKKRQKGLPALSKLNTNAGNVEKSIELFNMMQPDGTSSVDNMNGNVSSVGGEVSMGESLEEKMMENKTVVISYEDLPIEVPTKKVNRRGRYSHSFGNWLPDDPQMTEINVDWNYYADIDTLVELLQDIPSVEAAIDPDRTLTVPEYQEQIEENIEQLLEDNIDLVKEYFFDDAVKDAEEKYDYADMIYDSDYDESDESQSFDDKFDMSMRTLL